MLGLGALLYDRCMQSTENACLREWRKDLLQNVDGKVLEIGAGTGTSIELYPQRQSIDLFLLEPDRNMRSKLNTKVHNHCFNTISILPCSAEKISSEDNFFDVVFMSLVGCSVKDIESSLQEIKRVLKPHGRFLFLEHVAAKDGSLCRKWQNRLNPVWRKLAGNCHLNRETEQHIKNAGFTICKITHENMCTPMPLVFPTVRGIAQICEQTIDEMSL